MNNADIKTVVFDMYGVIMKDPVAGLMPFVRRHFPDLDMEAIYAPWLRANVGELSSLEYLRILGFTGDLSAIQKEYLDTIEIDGDFYGAAERLKRRFRLALLSNDLSEWSRYLREKHGLDGLFDAVVVSGDVKIKKPEPEIFYILLRRLGQGASGCVYIDDRKNNLDAAGSLGFDTVLYDNGWKFHDGGKGNIGYAGKVARSLPELADMLIYN